MIPWTRDDAYAAARQCLAEVRRWRDAERRARASGGTVAIGAYVSWPADKCRAACRQAIASARFHRDCARQRPWAQKATAATQGRMFQD